MGVFGSSNTSSGRTPYKNQPAFAGVELIKTLENKHVFAEQAEMEVI